MGENVEQLVRAALGIAEAVETERAGREVKREARREAFQVTRAAGEEAEARRKIAARLIATQLAKAGASGLSPVGSPLLVVQETARESGIEQGRIVRVGRERAARIAKRGRLAERAAKTQSLSILGESLITSGAFDE